jgi:hypothetical protein
MKKTLLSLCIQIMLCSGITAQVSDSVLTKADYRIEKSKFQERLITLEKKNADLQRTNRSLKNQIENVNLQLGTIQSNIKIIADSMHITVANVSNTNNKTQTQIQDIHQTLSVRSLMWILGIVIVALLSIIIFLVLRRKLSLTTRNLDIQIEKTNLTIQNEANKLDSKLIELLQTQLTLLKEERTIRETTASDSDHKLPLKVGNEIYRMRQRIISLKSEDKTLIPLIKSLERLEEEFNQEGYEIIDLLNKQFNDGLSVKATFIPSDTLQPGERIITRVIKPQINYNNQAIQMSEIEVSTGD